MVLMPATHKIQKANKKNLVGGVNDKIWFLTLSSYSVDAYWREIVKMGETDLISDIIIKFSTTCYLNLFKQSTEALQGKGFVRLVNCKYLGTTTCKMLSRHFVLSHLVGRAGVTWFLQMRKLKENSVTSHIT